MPTRNTTWGRFRRSGRGKPQNLDEAARHFRLAADQGQPEASHSAPGLDAAGRREPGRKTPVEAARRFTVAAEGGLPEAQTALAFAYLGGEGVERNDTMAAKWFTEAAMRGEPLAQDRLARLYFLGQGVARDVAAALLWLTLAERGGYEDETLRNSIEPEITPEITAQVEEQLAKWDSAAGDGAAAN